VEVKAPVPAKPDVNKKIDLAELAEYFPKLSEVETPKNETPKPFKNGRKKKKWKNFDLAHEIPLNNGDDEQS
jgi:hypothetical protein